MDTHLIEFKCTTINKKNKTTNKQTMEFKHFETNKMSMDNLSDNFVFLNNECFS